MAEGKHQSEPLQEEATMTSVREKLLETLEGLSHEDLEKFKWFLQQTGKIKGIPNIPRQRMKTAGRDEMVDLMVEIYGQQSVGVTREVLQKMKKDLLERHSFISSGLEVIDQLEPEQLQTGAATTVKEKPLEILESLRNEELKKFKWFLQQTGMKEGFPNILRKRMKTAGRDEMVDLMVEIYGQRSVEVTSEVLEKMMTDLLERCSDISSGLRVIDQLELLQTQGSSDWTKLEPEVKDGDEGPTYSLQSEAGNFECCVSSMRWVCKEKVSFTYQFCSTEEHMERIEKMNYMPAGPLLDVTITAGRFFEVYLPHWIRIDNNPEILDKFAVLHIDDCGDAVEKVSEVTSSHVKLSEPVFTAKMVLVKLGFSVEIGCSMLIYYVYQPKKDLDPSNLTLHVFLIPHDPALKEKLDKRKKGFKYIEKPRPNKCLKMHKGFSLKADENTAEIQPKEKTLRYCQDPNFYEVYIENPDRFYLTLSPYTPPLEPECEPVWTCEIRKRDYQPSADSEAAGSSAGCESATGGAVKETWGQSSIPSPKKHSADDHEAAQMQKEAVVKGKLLGILEDLKRKEFKDFKWHLVNSDIGPGLERITKYQLDGSRRSRVVDLMWETYVQQSVEVTRKVLEKMKKKDLVKKLRDTS